MAPIYFPFRGLLHNVDASLGNLWQSSQIGQQQIGKLNTSRVRHLEEFGAKDLLQFLRGNNSQKDTKQQTAAESPCT